MKTQTLSRTGIYLILILGLSGCVTGTPDSTFYKLSAVEPAEAVSSSVSADGTVIGVGPVDLAEVLDRPQLVTVHAGSELQIDEYHRWGGRLEDNIARIMATNISYRIPEAQVFALPWTVPVDMDYRLALNVSRLEGAPGSQARLEIDWILLDGRGRALTNIRKLRLSETVQGGSYAALIDAYETMFARLSKQVADSLKERIRDEANAADDIQ